MHLQLCPQEKSPWYKLHINAFQTFQIVVSSVNVLQHTIFLQPQHDSLIYFLSQVEQYFEQNEKYNFFMANLKYFLLSNDHAYVTIKAILPPLTSIQMFQFLLIRSN
jgi:L-rhamnose mutarotase